MADVAMATCVVSAIPMVLPCDVWWATQSGIPGTSIEQRHTSIAKVFPLLFGTYQQVWDYDVSGVLSGTVKEGVAAVPFALVVLFHRQTCTPVATAICDAAGAFSFPGLCKSNAAYFAIAFDPEGGTDFNALVLDKLTPV